MTDRPDLKLSPEALVRVRAALMAIHRRQVREAANAAPQERAS